MKRFKSKKWNPKNLSNRGRLFTFIAVFAVIGGLLILRSFAATPQPMNLEARVKADGLELANAKGPSTNATAIAKRRKADMVKLIQTDPDAAVRDAVPADTAKKLGKDTKDQVEETVTIGGTLTHSHGDQPQYDAKHNMTGLKDVDEQTYITNGKDKTYIYASKMEMEELNGNIVEVTGVKIGDQMAVSKTKTIPTPLITKGTVAKDVLGASTTDGSQPTNVLAATTTAPNVSQIYFGVQGYYNNPTLAGIQYLHSTTSDASGNGVSLAREEWDIDGTAVSIQTTRWGSSIRWDTSGYSLGQHTITYKTVDGFGVPSITQLTVTVGTTTIKRIALIAYQFQDYANGTWDNNGGNAGYQRLTAPVVSDWTFTGARSVTNYYHEDSYGQMTIQGKNGGKGDTYGVFTIPYNGADPSNGYPYCPANTWELSAKQQAQAAGWDPTQYDGTLLAGTAPAGCGSGQGGGFYDKVPWFGDGVEAWIRFAGHELGHSQGLPEHAHNWACVDASGNKVQISSNCTYDEYGDDYDIMGSGRVQHMNVYEKGEAGYFPSNSAQQTATVKTAGTYTLSPATLATAGVKSIRIPRNLDTSGNPLDYYYLEFRQPTPYNVLPTTDLKDYDGIQIREAPDYAVNETAASNIIDTTPNSLTGVGVYDQFDARLTPGHSFQDPATGITIKTLSTSSTGATFSLTYGTPQCERVAPTISPYDSMWVNPGQTVNTGVTITNNDSPACGASNFNLTSSVAAGLTQTPASTSVSVPPSGATRSISFTLTSSTSAASGYYPFTETVKNSASSQTASATGSYNISNNSTPPTATLSSPLNGANVSGSVPMAATASSSLGISRVDFTVDGTVVCSDATSPYTCDWNSTTVPNGIHFMSATAYDAAGANGYSSQAIVTVTNGADTTPPSAPTNLTAAAISSSQVSLSWSASTDNVGGSGIAGYNIVRGGTTIYQTTGSATTYGDTGLTPNTTYTYQVKARDTAGNVSVLSTSVNVTTPNQPVQDITAPTVSLTSPTNGATVSGSVALAANASDNTGGSGMNRVEFKVDGSLVNSDTTTPYSFTWDSTPLPNGTHFITATAYDNVGNLSSSQVQINVQNCADCIAPSTPTNVTATATSQTSVNLSWTASTDNVAVTGYYIIRDGVTLPPVGTGTTFADTGLLPGSTHSYQVKAFDAAGNISPASAVFSVTTPSAPDTIPPSPPINLIGNVASAAQVNLSWSPSTDNVGIARYDIYRSDNTRAPKASVSGTTTSFGDTTTLANKTYSYYIYAYDSAGNKSLTSNKITVTTPAVSTTNGSMTGRVVDGNGKVLTSGSIYYYLGTSKKSYNLNSNGNYTISGIVPNTYTFTYICTGCNTETVTGVQILASQNTARPDQVLHKLGSISGLVTDALTNKALSNVIIGYTLNGVNKTIKTSNHTPTNYALSGLPVTAQGTDYTITYTLSGYVTQTKTITLHLDQTLTQDITMSK